jgi:hypothetical protein
MSIHRRSWWYGRRCNITNLGWSDAIGIFLERSETDTRTLDLVVGSYATGNIRGIRTRPYSTNVSKNEYMYSRLLSIPVVKETGEKEPHMMGEVWANMWYELYWNLVDKYGFSSNWFDAKQTQGNIVAMQLLIGGVSLQPCNPTFLTARDAIIAFDDANYGGKYKCEIWTAFAKRGLGAGAIQTAAYTNNFVVPADACAEVTTATLPATTPVPVTTTETATTTTVPVETTTMATETTTVTVETTTMATETTTAPVETTTMATENTTVPVETTTMATETTTVPVETTTMATETTTVPVETTTMVTETTTVPVETTTMATETTTVPAEITTAATETTTVPAETTTMATETTTVPVEATTMATETTTVPAETTTMATETKSCDEETATITESTTTCQETTTEVVVITTEGPCNGYNCVQMTTTEVIAMTTDESTITDGPIISGANSIAVSGFALLFAFAF